jgi:hypothetical protein
MKNTTKTVIARADATIAAYRATMAKATPPAAPKAAAPVDKQAQAQASYGAIVSKHLPKYVSKGVSNV